MIGKNELTLPDKNPYIVDTPVVYSAPSISGDTPQVKVPTKILDNNGLVIWYKQDTTFKVPKGYLYIGIDSPFSISNIENIAMTRLFVDLYSDTVVEENYDAELAGIHYHLYAHQGGVTLQVSGISEKQNLLLAKLLSQLKHFQAEESHFALFKKQLIKYWENSEKSKSISQLFATLSSFMQPNNPSSKALAQALESITYQQYLDFSKQLFQHITIEVLIHGNWLRDHATTMKETIQTAFSTGISADNIVRCPVIDIHDRQTLSVPVPLTEHDHASVIYHPILNKDDTSIALTMVTSHLLSPLFFQQMRTEKQYGYIVGVGYVPINRYPGIAFYIQSPHVDSLDLVEVINEFIQGILTYLDTVSADDWQALKQGLAGQLQEKDQSLRIKSQRFWAAICNQDECFNHKEMLISAIISLTLEQISAFIKTNILPQHAPDRVILYSQETICSQGNNSLDESSLEKPNDVNLPANKQELLGKVLHNYEIFSKKCKRKF